MSCRKSDTALQQEFIHSRDTYFYTTTLRHNVTMRGIDRKAPTSSMKRTLTRLGRIRQGYYFPLVCLRLHCTRRTEHCTTLVCRRLQCTGEQHRVTTLNLSGYGFKLHDI
ncbi:hypothetical protein AVEN_161225-1 [Araneus ventricosus]|uniref:Uncharacterized protein n=1 Tax=Araneus ventricosus TaxID=182803 RepID=A0A4Y2NKE7_ARAVE|nr:hypothetical protein AVEN_161225-1 [Araneus ventricosus]